MNWKVKSSIFYFCLSFMVCQVIYAQNLVPNSGFEICLECPVQLGTFHGNVSAWSCPTQGTTDYFHNCSQKVGAPENFNGAQNTFEGNGYAGFYAYAPGNYREYMQVRLLSPLSAGTTYTISFNVSLAERSDFAIRDFGILFSSDSLQVPTKRNLSRKYWYSFPENEYHFMEMGAPGFLEDTSEWVRVEAEFQAKGSERYLILGNFRDNQRTPVRSTGRSFNKGAYYYIDQVELKPVIKEELVTNAPGPYPLDSLQVFDSLLFEFDTFKLSGMGQEELDSLYQFLSMESQLHLQVAGHTDGRGTSWYNQVLSERRCLAVVEYLKELGMASARIRWKGYGDSKPVASNETETGRSQNRRVEFKILRE